MAVGGIVLIDDFPVEIKPFDHHEVMKFQKTT